MVSLLLASLALMLPTIHADIFRVPEIDPNCTGEACGRLYLLNSEGTLLASLTGTHPQIRHKRVATATMAGVGCFRIFKGKHFRDKNMEIQGADPHILNGFSLVR
jgi:hypothetical protein